MCKLILGKNTFKYINIYEKMNKYKIIWIKTLF